MDDIDLILEGMQRELEEEQAEIRALGQRLAAHENGVRAELNPAIRRAEQLSSDIFELKGEYRRFTQIELAQQEGCNCCSRRSREERPREPDDASKREVAQLMMEAMDLAALTDDAVELLWLAWDDPKGAIASRADICGTTRADGRTPGETDRRWPATRWRAAVQLLEDMDLAERLRGRFECFELTWIGYRAAGLIHQGARPPRP